jgi:hypothetical protein
MTMERTELEWTYQPSDFFEAPYTSSVPDYSVRIDSGKAVATLGLAQDPIDEELERRIDNHVRNIFLIRKLQVHRGFDLAERATVRQYNAKGGIGIEIRVPTADAIATGEQVDFIIGNADGTLAHDSKADRITEYTSMLDMIAPKAAQSPTLRRMLESYSQSVSDPDNELVHLYEIRDALKAQYGNKSTRAKKALGITNDGWQRLGDLADRMPLSQGRHRGTHLAGTRSATAEELQEARTLARNWILAFAWTL